MYFKFEFLNKQGKVLGRIEPIEEEEIVQKKWVQALGRKMTSFKKAFINLTEREWVVGIKVGLDEYDDLVRISFVITQTDLM